MSLKLQEKLNPFPGWTWLPTMFSRRNLNLHRTPVFAFNVKPQKRYVHALTCDSAYADWKLSINTNLPCSLQPFLAIRSRRTTQNSSFQLIAAFLCCFFHTSSVAESTSSTKFTQVVQRTRTQQHAPRAPPGDDVTGAGHVSYFRFAPFFPARGNSFFTAYQFYSCTFRMFWQYGWELEIEFFGCVKVELRRRSEGALPRGKAESHFCESFGSETDTFVKKIKDPNPKKKITPLPIPRSPCAVSVFPAVWKTGIYIWELLRNKKMSSPRHDSSPPPPPPVG